MRSEITHRLDQGLFLTMFKNYDSKYTAHDRVDLTCTCITLFVRLKILYHKSI